MLLCPRGEGQIGPLPLVLRQAAVGNSLVCLGCRTSHDAWEATVAGVSLKSDLWHAAGLAGGTQTIVVAVVKAGERVILDLEQLGIPNGARVHRILQTPMGELYLLWITQTLGAARLPTQLVLAAVASDPENEPTSEVEVSLSIAWSPESAGHAEDDLLLSAATHFADGDLKRAVLDAHTASDLATREAVMPLLRANGLPSGERLGMLQRLSILESVTTLLQAPSLDNRVRQAVHELHRLRNSSSIAHGSGNVAEPQAATSVAAALVLMEWLKLSRQP